MRRQPSSDTSERPSLERPSLFAGMEDDAVIFVGDMQPVQILSTLESTRKASRKGRMPLEKIQGFTKKHSHWQTRGLMAAMGVGVISLLVGFVMVVKDERTGTGNKLEPVATSAQGSDKAPKAANTVTTSPFGNDNPLAALIAPSPPAALAQTTTAVIENVATTGNPASPPAAAPQQPLPFDTKVAMANPQPQPAPAPAAPLPAPASILTRELTPPKQANKAIAVTTTPKRAQPVRQRDEDVALLEAMFAHTHARQAPVSVADELRQECGRLSGGEAATCRARICVQNPTATVCHPD